jgi:hypothetical protein
MKLLKYSIILFLFLNTASLKSQDSCGLRISLLTCSPGAELYSVFGHNALRVVDSAAGTDIVYNYGTFDFDDPNFYTKFVRGKLMYFLSQQSFQNFKYEYEYFKRGIIEQVLSFDCIEKKAIQARLFDNMQEQKRYYKYDFLKDNCTTRLRDIIFNSASLKKDSLRLSYSISSSYRNYLHAYLDRAKMPWTTLGIDLLLGFGADMKMSLYESMFLPDYLQKEVGQTNIGNKKLVSLENVLVEDLQPSPKSSPLFGLPMFIFSVLSAIIILLGYSQKDSIKLYQRGFERILFFIIGLLGLLLVFTWFGTDHQSFSYNLNILWAFPLNIFLLSRMGKDSIAIKKLFKGYSICALTVLFVSFIFPGSINVALVPFIAVLSYRSWVLSKKMTKIN